MKSFQFRANQLARITKRGASKVMLNNQVHPSPSFTSKGKKEFTISSSFISSGSKGKEELPFPALISYKGTKNPPFNLNFSKKSTFSAAFKLAYRSLQNSLQIRNFSNAPSDKKISEVPVAASRTPVEADDKDKKVPPKPTEKSPGEKSFVEKSPDEVRSWFETARGGEFKDYASNFRALSGKSLAGLAKEDFLRRCPELGDVIYNAIQEELKKAQQEALLNVDPNKVSSDRRSIQNNPQYSWLKTSEFQKIKESKVLSLPRLSLSVDPKGFEDLETYNYFMLSQQRREILQEIIEFVTQKNLNKQSFGIIPSGPHGVGKSSIGLLLACYAFVNNYLVIYIPKCGQWLNQDEEEMAKYFVESFLELNADIVASLSTKEGTNLLRYLQDRSISWKKKVHDLLGLFSYQTHTPVFYIFDEHNELFRETKDGLAPLDRHPEFLRRFANFLGPLSGPRTIQVYIGSAHSKFEDNLSSGMERNKRYIRPLNEEEARMLITQKDSPLSLPENFWDTSSVKMRKTKGNKGQDQFVNLKWKRLEYATGWVPREISFLKYSLKDMMGENEDVIIDNFISERTKEFEERARKYYVGLKQEELPAFNTFIIQSLLPRLSSRRVVYLGGFYDKGLFYKDKRDIFYKCISGPAQRALQTYLSKALQSELKPINSITTPRERGIALEKALIARFISGEDFAIKRYQGGSNELASKQPTNISFKVEEAYYFQDEKNMPPNYDNKTVMYIPEDENYKGMDFIVHEGRTNTYYIFQVSVTAPWDNTDKLRTLMEAVKGHYWDKIKALKEAVEGDDLEEIKKKFKILDETLDKDKDKKGKKTMTEYCKTIEEGIVPLRNAVNRGDKEKILLECRTLMEVEGDQIVAIKESVNAVGIGEARTVLLYAIGQSKDSLHSKMKEERNHQYSQMYQEVYFFDEDSMKKMQIVF